MISIYLSIYLSIGYDMADIGGGRDSLRWTMGMAGDSVRNWEQIVGQSLCQIGWQNVWQREASLSSGDPTADRSVGHRQASPVSKEHSASESAFTLFPRPLTDPHVHRLTSHVHRSTQRPSRRPFSLTTPTNSHDIFSLIIIIIVLSRSQSLSYLEPFRYQPLSSVPLISTSSIAL